MDREQIIKALECCKSFRDLHACDVCPYFRVELGDNESCSNRMAQDAFALIKELTVELEAMRGAANSYKMHNEKLTEVVERSETARGCKESVDNGFSSSVTELQRENERLRGILLQFTDIVHKWGNKNGYDTSEISLIPILNEEAEITKQIRADTVRKMQTAIKEYYSKSCYRPTKQHPVKHTQIEHLFYIVDGIAKELIDGK